MKSCYGRSELLYTAPQSLFRIPLPTYPNTRICESLATSAGFPHDLFLKLKKSSYLTETETTCVKCWLSEVKTRKINDRIEFLLNHYNTFL